MTALSGRALGVACAAVLLAGCGGGGADRGSGPDASRDPVARTGSSPLARSAPVRLRIPAAGVDTPVMELGLEPDGEVEVPPLTADDRAGWYRHSPTPGQIGPSVLLGHVTVGRHGDGVFRHLGRLERGDRIEVTLRSGATAAFEVGEVRSVPKADFPADDVYGDVGRPELRLITCGGPRTGDEYRDNVIVFAGPAPTAG
ncbi:class F sortase [Streptomyces sp. enrichment culture]|uniref:class F sortase n=1 Tax=Streptomyces sp. enrichment culture TaxID=1795815 RepID=UPI003F573A99